MMSAVSSTGRIPASPGCTSWAGTRGGGPWPMPSSSIPTASAAARSAGSPSRSARALAREGRPTPRCACWCRPPPAGGSARPPPRWRSSASSWTGEAKRANARCVSGRRPRSLWGTLECSDRTCRCRRIWSPWPTWRRWSRRRRRASGGTRGVPPGSRLATIERSRSPADPGRILTVPRQVTSRQPSRTIPRTSASGSTPTRSVGPRTAPPRRPPRTGGSTSAPRSPSTTPGAA
mmetsp:Transcript_52970/g.140829  ORF Transcript_52970/g.140829 Transcript_52970/m.140829 type:complete len:234 (+) Transcript_52970:1224-1925(+)